MSSLIFTPVNLTNFINHQINLNYFIKNYVISKIIHSIINFSQTNLRFNHFIDKIFKFIVNQLNSYCLHFISFINY